MLISCEDQPPLLPHPKPAAPPHHSWILILILIWIHLLSSARIIGAPVADLLVVVFSRSVHECFVWKCSSSLLVIWLRQCFSCSTLPQTQIVWWPFNFFRGVYSEVNLFTRKWNLLLLLFIKLLFFLFVFVFIQLLRILWLGGPNETATIIKTILFI